MIIGLAGAAGAGKDTVAQFISVNELRCHAILWQRYAFASPIKEACKRIFNWDGRHENGELKEVVDPFFGVSPRVAYQTLGTEWGRNIINEDIWLLVAEKFTQNHEHVMITDVRFPNEVQWLRKQGGKVLFVHRETSSVGVEGHASEQGVEPYLIDSDYILHNTGSIADLYSKIQSKQFRSWLYDK